MSTARYDMKRLARQLLVIEFRPVGEHQWTCEQNVELSRCKQGNKRVACADLDGDGQARMLLFEPRNRARQQEWNGADDGADSHLTHPARCKRGEFEPRTVQVRNDELGVPNERFAVIRRLHPATAAHKQREPYGVLKVLQ